jgi:heme A synthase
MLSGTVAGIWGLILFFQKKVMDKPLRIAMIVTLAIGCLQGLLGVVQVLLGLKPGGGTGLYYLHYVYGAIVVLALPVALTYTTSGKNARRDLLIFSLGALILAAAAVRAWVTGPAPH